MNDKIARQVEEMKQQTIGVELEMSNITRQKTAQVVAKYFGTENTVSYDGGGYDVWSCKDRKGRTWKAMSDSSIRGRHTAELTTPILTYDDLEDLLAVARELRHAGAISNPEHGCGVHIHISANGHTAGTLRNLANIMASHESLLIDALNLDRSRINQYCRTVDPAFLQRLNRKKPKTLSGLADIWYQDSYGSRNTHYNPTRYHMLNLHATFTKGTVEFRLFQFDNPGDGRKGGIHAGQLRTYIQLCLALIQMAKEVKTASPKPQQNENPKYAMRTWLLRLGFIGDEFQTARYILTKRLGGDAAFRNGRAA